MNRDQIKFEIKKSLGVTVDRHASRIAALIAAGERQLAGGLSHPKIKAGVISRLEIAREIQAELAVQS